MKAIGFTDPEETIVGERKKKLISLKFISNKHNTKNKVIEESIALLKCKRHEIEQEVIALEGAPSVAAALRELRAHHTIQEVRSAADTALTLVRNVLLSPKDLKVYRVKKGNPSFHRNLGRLQGSALLMRAIGFVGGGGEEASLANTMDPHNDPNHTLNSGPAAYVLKSISASGFDASAVLGVGSGGAGIQNIVAHF